jgi:hypothetical protein
VSARPATHHVTRAGARRLRLATSIGLVLLLAVDAWFAALVPGLVAFGVAVAAAVVWCVWLERHPQAVIREDGRGAAVEHREARHGSGSGPDGSERNASDHTRFLVDPGGKHILDDGDFKPSRR